MGGPSKSASKFVRTPTGGTLSLLLIGLVGGGSLAVGMSPSCTQSPGPGSALPRSAQVGPPASTAEATPAQAELDPAPASYADAIRRRKFERAAQLIDSAPQKERETPEVLYARARVALQLDDIDKTLRLADELAKSSPLFRDEAEELRLEAAKESHDVTLLAHFLGASKEAHDRLLLAEAHEKSASGQDARKIADEVLLDLQKEKGSEADELRARARAVRARTLLSEDKKAEAAREFHWLATEGVSLDPDGKFDELAESLDPVRKLTIAERKKRLEVFSKSGLVGQCESEIQRLESLSKAAATDQESLALLAWSVYRARTDYERAAQLFSQAASLGGKDRREYLYYEAKSLARSHRDRDAIGKYEAVAAMGGTYADHAAYQAARLKFIDGQWAPSVAAYEKYLAAFGRNAKHRHEAQADLPIARLAAGDYAKAFVELKSAYEKESNDRERARVLQLMGVARLGEKKSIEAAEIFRRVIDYRPLSFAALLSAARLAEMGEPVPPWIAPPKTPDSFPQEPPLSVSLPEKAWRLSRVGLDEEAERALRREESTLKKQYRGRSDEALCRTYGLLESAHRRYQIAQTAASWSVLSYAPGPNTEWQWDCIYPEPYEPIVQAEAERYEVPAPLVYAVMRQESAFRPAVVSPADAVGLMQIIPSTAQRIAAATGATYSPDAMRAPAVNISFGAYYLRYLMDIFSGRLELVLASYNAGPHAVTRWLRAGETLPLDIFVARIPYSETRNYVYRVMGNYARYAYRDDDSEFPKIDLKIPKGLAAPASAY